MVSISLACPLHMLPVTRMLHYALQCSVTVLPVTVGNKFDYIIFCSGQSSNEISELNTTPNESTDPSDELSTNTSSILITPSVATSNEDIDYLQPNQPSDISSIPPKRTKIQNVYSQKSWFEKYPWIHYYEPSLKLIVCFTCSKAARLNLVQYLHVSVKGVFLD